MKPSSNDYRRLGEFRRRQCPRFPNTDCAYQAPFSLDRFHGGPAEDPGASFLNISQEYFRYEARRNFLAEGAFFLAIVAILAVMFISGALAIIHFLHLPAA